ncbi:MAG TPA: hypothetical protein VIW24_10375 [Aldersonia sp.]
MTNSGDLEGRVTALEQQVGDLARRVLNSEHDATAARVLAGGADRDVGEIRAEIREFRELNTRLHNATRADIADLRAGQAEMRADIADLRTGQAEMRADITDLRTGQTEMRADITDLRTGQADLRANVTDLREQMSNGFIEMRAKFDATAAGQQRIVELLGEIIDKRND